MLWESEKYLATLARRIVEGDYSRLLPYARRIVQELKPQLEPAEWTRLPEFLAQCRARTFTAPASEIRREAAQRAQMLKEAEARRAREEAAVAARERKSEEKRQQALILQQRVARLIEEIQAAFRTSFLTVDKVFQRHPDRILLSDMQYSDLKSAFVQKWTKDELAIGLDLEQAAAVGATIGDVQVIARAGSGKTRTLIARALLLQKLCGVRPDEILLLAFNRDAAAQMKEKLAAALQSSTPHVMTFHALAHAIVHPEEDLLFDNSSEDNRAHSRAIQKVIDAHLQSDRHRPLIRDLMLAFFREDWEQIANGGFHLPLDELLTHRRALPRETLRGEYVKSFGEKLIANVLFENAIDYKYERNFNWDGVNYRPDFTVLRPDGGGVVVEYFGLKGDPDYDEMTLRKRRFWEQQKNWTLVEVFPSDIGTREVAGFASVLLGQLEASGIAVRRLSDQEIWQRIERRAIDSFTGAARSFVSRCRKAALRPDELHDLIEKHEPITEAERLFLAIASSVFAGYLKRLAADNLEDFDGLLTRAISCIREGRSSFIRDKGRERGDLSKIRFILVDEFQDFSDSFYALFQAMRSINPPVAFFGVGDDWQAINGFAGSELKYFQGFDSYFSLCTTLYLSTNYRSPAQIVEIGNALMKDLGKPARPAPAREDTGWVRSAYLSKFAPSSFERDRHSGDSATPALLRIINLLLEKGLDIVMLSRRNRVPWYVNYTSDNLQSLDGLEKFTDHIRGFLREPDQSRLSASTAHRYKGREKSAVVVLDADEGSYPLIHPHWIFLRVFGDDLDRIEAEQRRLFYVALTRSAKALVILSNEEKRASPYLEEIAQRMALQSIDWSRLSPAPSLGGEHLEVRISNAIDVRDQLKGLGYRWNRDRKYWYRTISAERFDFLELRSQTWATPQVRIQVYSANEKLVEDSWELTNADAGAKAPVKPTDSPASGYVR